MKTTNYFKTSVMARRSNLKPEWIEHVMMFEYYPDTDMLYIKLVDGISTESEEVAPGVVLDFDQNNRVIGVEIEDASKFIDLSRLELRALPVANLIFSERIPAAT